MDLAIILAAGEGTRMRSAKAKVLHEIAGRTLIGHVLAALDPLAPKERAIVVGAKKESVEEHLLKISPGSLLVHQEIRNGTGAAARLALDTYLSRNAGASGHVVILAGDTPLLTSKTLLEFQAHHLESGAKATVLTAEVFDPTGYGRIIRDESGKIARIVEDKDCKEFEREIDEINSGVYIFDITALQSALSELSSANAQGEQYLTDVISILKKRGEVVAGYLIEDESEIIGVNDRRQLAIASSVMRDRINDALMQSGVTITDPLTTWVDLTVEIAPDVTLLPGTELHGRTIIETGAEIGPRSTLIDATVGQDARVIESYVRGAAIGYQVQVGPFSFLREGTELATGSRVGAYVEVKNSFVGEGSKVPHLSYVGDATIGRETNIGAATVFVNYDGVEKHRTEVGDHVRIGSDTMLVAPVTVGDGAYTAAGSVITEDVPPGAMGVGRSRQSNIIDWVLRRRSNTKSAEAAKKAADERAES
ncbi:MAG: bifunctional UDP-N-acetylglucosamine diphosphorylase/glucosamine-1-phosphate N-acetyltransferase GlmU [Candidatus Nanopelagicaceae bacterium]